MKRKIISLILTAFAYASTIGFSQEITQVVRGTVIDQDSRATLIGANVVITNSENFLGASADVNGNFRIENVPIGRIDLKISFLGYEEKTIPNIVVGSGKEVVLEIELIESLVKLKEVEITATKNSADILNEMALISARTFSVEETKRYAGSFNDPARLVSTYAGVTGDAEGDNNIVVRGNSSKGILWRLEGIEIPNPNHFANEGYTGGPINALNSSMLANSDFYTGAFAPEYGNAFSGVFDMKLRVGNNEHRESSFSAGILGIDFTTEGPIKKGSNASYLINYRYSSLAIFEQLKIITFGGVPKYQDASFKVQVPTKKLGVFSAFGLGGYSAIYQEYMDDKTDSILAANEFHAFMGVVGVDHTYPLGKKTYLKSTISYAGNGSGDTYEELSSQDNKLEAVFMDDVKKTTTRFNTTLNHKFNAKHKIKAGVIYSLFDFDFNSEYKDRDKDVFITELKDKGSTGLFQSFYTWKYRINEDITMVSGIHYMQLMLNNNYSIEPRLGLKWQLSPIQSINIGFGVHSKTESLTSYFSKHTDDNGIITTPNKNAGIGKANHYVLGYDRLITEFLHFKTEVYYQSLYDILIEDNESSSYSVLNSDGGFTDRILVNEGTGHNYGIELTLERFFSKNLFYMITASLYESKYKGMDGITRDSRYNGNYAGNIVFGKEFNVGKSEKNRIIGVSSKAILMGGKRYTPINLERSREVGYQVRVDDPYSAKGDDVFRLDLAIYYRRDRKKTTHEIKMDVQNLTDNKAAVNEYYNSETMNIERSTQLPMLPVLSYKIDF